MLRINQLIGFGAGGGELTATALNVASFLISPTTEIVIFTTSTVAAGESIVLVIACNSATVASVTDTAGNGYSLARTAANGDANVEIWQCLNPVTLPSGATLTVTLSDTSSGRAMSAFRLGRAAVPLTTGSADDNSDTPSVTTDASVAANVVVFGAMQEKEGGAVPTQPGGIWTSDLIEPVSFATVFAHGITTSAGTVTYNPTLDDQRRWAAAVAAYG